MKKAAFYTLGCKVNYYETEALKSLFEKEGYTNHRVRGMKRLMLHYQYLYGYPSQ